MSKVQIRITSKRDGFRRAGRSHSRTPTIHEADAFTMEELEVLRAEPMLTVEGIVAEEKEQSPPPPPGPENNGKGADTNTDATSDGDEGNGDNAGSGSSNDGEQGENGVELSDIVMVILGLDKANPKLWTGDGSPQVRAIEAVLGRQITAGERDAAWVEVRELAIED